MKKSHRKDVIIARIIFAAMCIALSAIIIGVVSLINSHRGGNKADTQTQTQQTESMEPGTLNPELPPVSDDAQGTENDTVYVWTTTGVNLRSEPNTDCQIVSVLDAETQLEVLSDEGEWLKVSYNGTEGYVSSEFVTGDEPEDIPME